MDIKELEIILKNELINFNGKVAIYADDLNGNTISINSQEEQNPASCIKVFILIELMKQVYFGRKNLNDKLIYTLSNQVIGSGILRLLTPGLELCVKDVATLMMVISDNVATNMMIDYLGIDNINKTIQEIGCINTKLYSKFDYEKSSKPWQFSKTTAEDYALAYRKIAKHELWDSSVSEQIITIMKNGKYCEMVGEGIPKIYRKIENSLINYVATKSGKSNAIRNDGVLFLQNMAIIFSLSF